LLVLTLQGFFVGGARKGAQFLGFPEIFTIDLSML
jgi:hypothetical protein